MRNSVAPEAQHLNSITDRIIAAAVAVHRELGPGKLESAYDACLAFELIDRGHQLERQRECPVIYRGQRLECGYRVDLIVDGLVVVEIKAVESVHRVHKAQLKSYLRLLDLKLGLLINFNVPLLRDGINRVVNGFPE